jgi:hypothetical protein
VSVGRPGSALVVVKSLYYSKDSVQDVHGHGSTARKDTHSGKSTMQKDLYRKDGNTSARISTHAGMQNDIQGCMRSWRID